MRTENKALAAKSYINLHNEYLHLINAAYSSSFASGLGVTILGFTARSIWGPDSPFLRSVVLTQKFNPWVISSGLIIAITPALLLKKVIYSPITTIEAMDGTLKMRDALLQIRKDALSKKMLKVTCSIGLGVLSGLGAIFFTNYFKNSLRIRVSIGCTLSLSLLFYAYFRYPKRLEARLSFFKNSMSTTWTMIPNREVETYILSPKE